MLGALPWDGLLPLIHTEASLCLSLSLYFFPPRISWTISRYSATSSSIPSTVARHAFCTRSSSSFCQGDNTSLGYRYGISI